jgi:hypothetical protein
MTSEVVCLEFPRDTSIRLTQCVDSFMVEADHRAERFGTTETLSFNPGDSNCVHGTPTGEE